MDTESIYKRWCPVEEKEIGYDEIKKGYEVTKDSYIAIEKKRHRQYQTQNYKYYRC